MMLNHYETDKNGNPWVNPFLKKPNFKRTNEDIDMNFLDRTMEPEHIIAYLIEHKLYPTIENILNAPMVTENMRLYYNQLLRDKGAYNNYKAIPDNTFEHLNNVNIFVEEVQEFFEDAERKKVNNHTEEFFKVILKTNLLFETNENLNVFIENRIKVFDIFLYDVESLYRSLYAKIHTYRNLIHNIKLNICSFISKEEKKIFPVFKEKREILIKKALELEKQKKKYNDSEIVFRYITKESIDNMFEKVGAIAIAEEEIYLLK